MVSERTLISALRAGEREEHFHPTSLLAALEPRRGRPGMTLARRVLLAHQPAPGRLRSGLESEFWHLVATDPEIENPEINVRVGGYEADMLWRRLRLIAEVDGGTWHGTTVDAIRDAARDAAHRALGFIVLRFSEDDVEHRTGECLASLKATITSLEGAYRKGA